MTPVAFILAAGLGTRLRPWTLSHPKALVPLGGVPMLQRVMQTLAGAGFGRQIVNVHHFASQIEDFLALGRVAGVEVEVSDERSLLLDTGGALVKGRPLFGANHVLVHNVDILSNAPLEQLYATGLGCPGLTLLVSNRESSRRLAFDSSMQLCGWHNLNSGEQRQAAHDPQGRVNEYAFSGIYVAGAAAVEEMEDLYGTGRPFSVIDYMLDMRRRLPVQGVAAPGLELIDIGKPETLSRAESLFAQ